MLGLDEDVETRVPLVVWVRVLCAVAAAQGFPVVWAAALRTRRQRLDGRHLDFVAAVRAAVGAGRDIAPDWGRICHACVLSGLPDLKLTFAWRAACSTRRWALRSSSPSRATSTTPNSRSAH